MGRAISEYQLRLFRDNGVLTIVAVTNAMDPSDATYQAERFLTADITKIEIWCGGALIKRWAKWTTSRCQERKRGTRSTRPREIGSLEQKLFCTT
jgi:hypothetical protein